MVADQRRDNTEVGGGLCICKAMGKIQVAKQPWFKRLQFLCKRSSGHHSQNLHLNWGSGGGPSGNPPSPQATVQEMRKQSNFQPESQTLDVQHLCSLWENLQEKKKDSQAAVPGSVSWKVILHLKPRLRCVLTNLNLKKKKKKGHSFPGHQESQDTRCGFSESY